VGREGALLALPLASCMPLIRGVAEIWIRQDDTTVPVIPDSLIEGFPETIALAVQARTRTVGVNPRRFRGQPR
jgi:hypothetical protein